MSPRLTPAAWRSVREEALALGFADFGAAPAEDLASARARLWPAGRASTGLPAWLEAGMHADMGYMAVRARDREDPRRAWPACRTVLAGLVPYDGPSEPGEPCEPPVKNGERPVKYAEPGEPCERPVKNAEPPEQGGDAPRARVARYAWGRDYHFVVRGMLRTVARRLQREVPGAEVRLSVDRSLFMEKPLAVLAGLGWIGKHGNLLRRDRSSWFLIGLVLTDAETTWSEPFTADHCGTCTACVDACPTAAIVAPGVVDGRRCISALTIETRKAAPRELREAMGSWVFGCDACQDACPWNSHRTREGHPRLGRGLLQSAPRLADLLSLDERRFATLTPKSAVKRAGRVGLVRNGAIAAGNSGDASLVPALARLLGGEPDGPLRVHAAWALGRLGGRAARAALDRARSDPDAAVGAEAVAALEASSVSWPGEPPPGG